MKVGLIHHTEDYHKLVEFTARECYQSWHKLSDTSEGFVKSIMAKGHISIASTGNMVFGIAGFSGIEEFTNIMLDLMIMKEINNYVRWTTPDQKKNPDAKIGVVVSMNMLSFLDINNKIEEYSTSSNIFENMRNLVNRVPELKWFLNKNTKLEPKDNQYTKKGEPELYNPVILTEDYTDLKSKGLTDYELDVHATVTVNMKVDRATGLQAWRHADMTGGTELSQRYVERSDAEYRKMVDVLKSVDLEKTKEFMDKEFPEDGLTPEEFVENALDEFYSDFIENEIKDYAFWLDYLEKLGVRKGRAKEIARAGLPNAMTTKLIQARPMRQWKHFFNLRDTKHAQSEIEADTKALKEAFTKVGIEF